MAGIPAEIESERDEARRELSRTVAAISEKVEATRAELYPPTFAAGVIVAMAAGFLLGLRRDDPWFSPPVYAAAGYCGWRMVNQLWRAR